MSEPSSYVPRVIGIGPPIGSTKSGKMFEFIARGKDEVGSLSKLNGVLNAHHVKVSSAGGYSVDDSGAFAWSGYADYSQSEYKVEQTLAELKKLSFVTKVDASRFTDVLFDKFLFPVTMLGNQRVILVRAHPLVRVEKRLMAAFGSGGASILFDEGRNYSLESFQNYLDILPGASPAVLIKNAIAGLRATGWGIFEIETSKLSGEGTAKVSIKEPPFGGMPGVKESFFINGLAAGAIEAILKVRVGVQSSTYDEKNRILHLWMKRLD